MRKGGVPQASPHWCRHTFATLHLLAGTHFKVVAEALGHSSVAITLDRYSHLIPTTQDEAAIRLDEFLGRDPAPNLPSLISRIFSGYGPNWGGLQTRWV